LDEDINQQQKTLTRKDSLTFFSGGSSSMRNFPLDANEMMMIWEGSEEENEATFMLRGGDAGLDDDANGGGIVLEIRNWCMAILFLWLCREAVRIGLHRTYWNTNTGNG
jgi:hypothetical protein